MREGWADKSFIGNKVIEGNIMAGFDYLMGVIFWGIKVCGTRH
jgi:hypothetical protein